MCILYIDIYFFSLDREFLLFAQPGSDREDLGREEYQNRHDDVPVVERERGGDLQGRIFEKRPGRTLVNIRADSGADFGQNQQEPYGTRVDDDTPRQGLFVPYRFAQDIDNQRYQDQDRELGQQGRDGQQQYVIDSVQCPDYCRVTVFVRFDVDINPPYIRLRWRSMRVRFLSGKEFRRSGRFATGPPKSRCVARYRVFPASECLRTQPANLSPDSTTRGARSCG